MLIKYLLIILLYKAIYLYTIVNCINKLNNPQIDLNKQNQYVSSLENNQIQYCLTKENTRGVCIRVSLCKNAKKDLTKYRPNICYWDGLEPIACCDDQMDETSTNSIYTLPNSRIASSTPYPHYTYSSQQQQQIYVTIKTFRDENKPISVRPPLNYIISQNKNYSSISTTNLIYRREDLSTTDFTTNHTPLKRTKNYRDEPNFNSTHTQTKPPIDYNESKEKWKLNNEDNKNNDNRNNQKDKSDRINTTNENSKPVNNDEDRSSTRRNSKNRITLPKCGKRINTNNGPQIRIVKGNETKKQGRSKRFISPFYSSSRSSYYSTRPIYKSSSSLDFSNAYRTIPLRSANKPNNLNNFFNSPLVNSPIVNINPSNKPSSNNNNNALPAENSNANDYSSTTKKQIKYSTSSTTTNNPLSTIDKIIDDDYDNENSDDSFENLKQECGGSIISVDKILSAGHCFSNLDPSLYKVGVGSHILKNLNLYSVKKIHLHPKYNPKKFYHDLAIVEIDGKFHFDEDVQPICLPDRDLLRHFNLDDEYLGSETDEENTFEERRSKPKYNSNRNKSTTLTIDGERNPDVIDPNSAVVVGFGSLKYGSSILSDKLRKAYLKLVKQDDCDIIFRKLRSSSIADGITNSFICAHGDLSKLDVLSDDVIENSSPDSCQNDSGGPLIARLVGSRSDFNKLSGKFSSLINFRNDDEWQYNWIQLGVVSFGFRCGTNYPGVYTSIPNHLDWINSIVL